LCGSLVVDEDSAITSTNGVSGRSNNALDEEFAPRQHAPAIEICSQLIGGKHGYPIPHTPSFVIDTVESRWSAGGRIPNELR
jgi:hypothetical protein